MKMKLAIGLMFLLVVGCSATNTSDQSKVEFIALEALSKWVKKNPLDASQIEGASVSGITREGKLIHVTLKKEVSRGAYYFHDAYFHVYLNGKDEVVKVVRGPDAIS